MILDNKTKEILARWKDFGEFDLELFKELPNWRVIVSDIKHLISIIQEYDDQDVFNEGYEIGHVDGYDEGYSVGTGTSENK